jgi:hypothetical protein
MNYVHFRIRTIRVEEVLMQTTERVVVIGAGYQHVDGALRRGRRTAEVIHPALATRAQPVIPGPGG